MILVQNTRFIFTLHKFTAYRFILQEIDLTQGIAHTKILFKAAFNK